VRARADATVFGRSLEQSDVYLSPVVRRMRDDPLPDQRVTLLVRLGDEAPVEDVHEAATAVGAELEGETQFDGVLVALPEPDVDAFLALLPEAVAAVETSGVTGLRGDAGEDVRPERWTPRRP
jgi:hypothetical protein